MRLLLLALTVLGFRTVLDVGRAMGLVRGLCVHTLLYGTELQVLGSYSDRRLGDAPFLSSVILRTDRTITLGQGGAVEMQQSNNSSVIPNCINERSHAVFTSWLVVYLLIFPVFISVIYFSYRKWQTHRQNVSHSDVFTFHMVAMELLNLAGSCMYFGGFMLQFMNVLNFGLSLKHFSSVGEMCFHCLTCVERYLAVVQPMTYLRLKKRGGVMIRNVGIGCAWLLSVISLVLASTTNHNITDPLIFGFAIAVLSIVLVLFCSVSVLCVLIRPGPGEGGGDRKRINQTKRAAVNTIMAILGALLLRMVAVGFYYVASSQSDIEVCTVVLCTFWFAMPSSLVLPLLFLHRERIIPSHRNSLKSKHELNKIK